MSHLHHHGAVVLDSEDRSSTDEFIKGLWRENPIFVQVMGMCPALAVSNTARNALAMGLATLFGLLMSNTVISLLRRFIPSQVRIATKILGLPAEIIGVWARAVQIDTCVLLACCLNRLHLAPSSRT